MFKLHVGLSGQAFIIRLEDNACIPVSEENRDYLDYLEWRSQGNEPEPADPPPEL